MYQRSGANRIKRVNAACLEGGILSRDNPPFRPSQLLPQIGQFLRSIHLFPFEYLFCKIAEVQPFLQQVPRGLYRCGLTLRTSMEGRLTAGCLRGVTWLLEVFWVPLCRRSLVLFLRTSLWRTGGGCSPSRTFRVRAGRGWDLCVHGKRPGRHWGALRTRAHPKERTVQAKFLAGC